MTYAELLAERMGAALMAQRDQILFGTCCIEKWIDEEGNERSKHVPISEVYFTRGTQK